MLITISVNDTSEPPYPPFQTGQNEIVPFAI